MSLIINLKEKLYEKILTILGALTLTTSTGLSVIACGTNREEGKVPPISQELIKEYQNELTKIWNSVYNENADKFIRKIGESGDQENYHLFNLNYLDSKYQHIPGTNTFDLHKEQINAEMFQKDLNLLFPKNQFESKIQSNIATGKDAIKYRNLYMGSPSATLGEFRIAEDKPFQVTKTAYKENEVQEQLYSIVATVSRNMFYKDAQGQTEVFRVTEIPLNIIIGKDGIAITLIENIATNLPKNLFIEQGTQFTTSTIKQTNSKFKTYDDNLELNLANHVNSDNFKNIITAEIDKLNNNQEEIELTYGSKISEEGEINLISTMLRNDNQKQVETKRLFDIQRNPLANSLILKKPKTEFLDQDNAVVMLEEIVKNLDSNIEAHETDLNTFLDLYFLKNEPKDNLIEQTHSFGNLRLNKIQLDVKKQGLSLELPTMIVPWTYRNDFDNNLNKKELWLISIYNALKIVNEKVMTVNETYYEYSTAPVIGIFALSAQAQAKAAQSFTISKNEIIKITVESRPQNYAEYLTYGNRNPKDDPGIFKTKDNITWLDLATPDENYVINENKFDFSDFSARIESRFWDNETDQKTGSVYMESYGDSGSTRNHAAFGVNGYYESGQNSTPQSFYIFNIGKLTFNISIPDDNGLNFASWSIDEGNNWNGKEYFNLSKDRSLLTRPEIPFDWNLNSLNPYKYVRENDKTRGNSWLNRIGNKGIFRLW